MSIATELENYKAYLTNAYNKCQTKGAIMPAQRNLYNLTACIDTLLDRQSYIALTTETGDVLTTESGEELEADMI